MKNCKCNGCHSEEKRFCLMKDDDGHDYLVPWELRDRFNELVEDEDNWEAFAEEFADMETGVHPSWISFTDPREER